VTRTLQALLEDARTALVEAGLSDLDWTMADVIAARRTQSGMMVGELGWRSRRVRFACVDRSVGHKLDQNGTPWRAGLSGCFALRLVIHPRFGFQAEVYDVLTESLGQATSVERIAAVCDRIEREGWAERQRRLPDPGVPERLAVVTSPTAQGLSDFLATVQGLCPVTLVKAAMGGDFAARSVATAIRRASLEAEVVVVLRGGRAASSMEWADDERVVEAVATSPRPVWVAVDHADDRHLLDIVAHKSFATPTQAAAELRRRDDLRAAAEREDELRRQRQAAELEAWQARRRASAARRAAAVAAAVAVGLLAAAVGVLVRGGF
jgi:exodeoxyribonuclease VII large subunit